MTHEQALEIILNPRGSPPPGSPERREFEEYLRASPECRQLFEAQQAVWRAMDDWSAPEPSPAFDARLFAQIEAERGRRSWFERSMGGFRLPLAAALAGLLLAAGTVLRQQTPASPEAPMTVAVEPPESQYVQQINRALDDLEMLADFAAPAPSIQAPGES